jgi:hypothetical protein
MWREALVAICILTVREIQELVRLKLLPLPGLSNPWKVSVVPNALLPKAE